MASVSANTTGTKRRKLGDIMGGLAAMLVALPSAVAFGIIVFGPLGSGFAAVGATAGIVGTVALGVVAPLAGGAPRLISAPCAPAAAVLGAFTAAQAWRGSEEAAALLLPVCLIAGLLQLAFGLARGGRLVKFIPYSVVGGYLSAVGLLIILGQLPKALMLPHGMSLWAGLRSPASWHPVAVGVGLVAASLMLAAGRFAKFLPAPIVALVGGTAAYFACGVFRAELLTLEGNPLVIGRIAGGLGGLLQHVRGIWGSIGVISAGGLYATLAPAATLAVLLSIDTLKTCIIVDALTRSRHNSNRELMGQGLANITSAVSGGLAGAGTMGATLINLSGGGQTRFSGLFEGLFAAAVFLAFGSLVAWIPVPALAGILIVVGFRMIDRSAFRLLRQRSTVLDFIVSLAVVATALAANLIAAAGAGIALSILIFIREQIRSSVVRRRLTAAEIPSKKQRLPDEKQVLSRRGRETAIFELQGALFFGTTDKLMSEMDPHLAGSRHVVLDMRRVQAVDFSAAHLLEMLAARLAERGGRLVFAALPRTLPTGQNLEEYFKAMRLTGGEHGALIFPALDDALEWIEDQVLKEEAVSPEGNHALELGEFEMFDELSPDLLALLNRSVRPRSFPTGAKIFCQGDTGDTFYVIRRGEVGIYLPLESGSRLRIISFGRGDFFGDMSFLDRRERSADAVATCDTEVFEISRSTFDETALRDPRLGWHVYSGLARVLAVRLRHTNTELRALADA